MVSDDAIRLGECFEGIITAIGGTGRGERQRLNTGLRLNQASVEFRRLRAGRKHGAYGVLFQNGGDVIRYRMPYTAIVGAVYLSRSQGIP